MPDIGFDLLAINRGSITAPAGCGKTWLIADALRRHLAPKPVLILTHTNAGVAALRKRLHDNAVPGRSYRLMTIDGWAIKLISTFPARSAHDPAMLVGAKPNYPAIQSAASSLLATGHITDILRASYSRLFVDEYQDCSLSQHQIVVRAAETLDTVVLGDPMQAIFGFRRSPTVNWNEDVHPPFPPCGQLHTPHRWIRAGASELGQWFLNAYETLGCGEKVDIRDVAGIVWIQMDGSEGDHERKLLAARHAPSRDSDRVLIIGDSTSPASQQDFARRIPGAITVEAVDMRDLVAFADAWDLSARDALHRLMNFAAKVMNIPADPFLSRIGSLTRGTARNQPTSAENAALRFQEQRSFAAAAALLNSLRQQPGIRPHRPAILNACLRALHIATLETTAEFRRAVALQRDQYRAIGRHLPRRGVGSTLLCKGLEVEVVIILNADSLNASNLYVAMTRASNTVVVCSTSPVLPIS